MTVLCGTHGLSLTLALEVVRRERVYGPVPVPLRRGAPGPRPGEPLGTQPLGQPPHVAVAVDGVGDEVEGAQAAEGLEGARRHARDGVGEEVQRLHTGQPAQDAVVHAGDGVL